MAQRGTVKEANQCGIRREAEKNCGLIYKLSNITIKADRRYARKNIKGKRTGVRKRKHIWGDFVRRQNSFQDFFGTAFSPVILGGDGTEYFEAALRNGINAFAGREGSCRDAWSFILYKVHKEK